MDKDQWAVVRRRIYFTLPWAGALMTAYGVTTDTTAALWVGLVGAAVGPAHGTMSALNTPKPGRGGEQALYRGM